MQSPSDISSSLDCDGAQFVTRNIPLSCWLTHCGFVMQTARRVEDNLAAVVFPSSPALLDAVAEFEGGSAIAEIRAYERSRAAVWRVVGPLRSGGAR